MGIDIVRQPLMAAFITLLVAAVAMAVGAGMPISEPVLTAECPSVVGGYLYAIDRQAPVVSLFLGAILFFAAGTMLGRTAVRYALYGVHTHLVMPLYGLMMCMLFSGPDFLLATLCSALFVGSLGNLYACFRNGSYGFGEIFRGTLFLGLIPLIYTPAWILGLGVPLVVILFKRSYREMLVAVAGYLLPVSVACYLNWATEGAIPAPLAVAMQALNSPCGFSLMQIDPLGLIGLGLAGVLYLLSMLSYFLYMHTSALNSRSILLLNLFLFVVACAMFFVPCGSGVVGAFIAVPAAMVLPMLFVRLGRGVAALLYLAILFICILRLFL